MDTPEQFWNWFKDNNKAYTFLDAVDENAKDKLLDDFEKQLHKNIATNYFLKLVVFLTKIKN